MLSIEKDSSSKYYCAVADRSHNSLHDDYSTCQPTVIDREEPSLALRHLIDRNVGYVAHFLFSATTIQVITFVMSIF